MAVDLPEDLDLLVALDVLLRERHVTRAARRLGVTQGAASQRLARLRDYFRDPLLVPGRPLLVPTARALAVAEPLSRALADLRAAVRRGAAFEPASSDRRFVMLGNDIAEARALPPLLAILENEAPHVSLSVERVDADFVERLEKGTADLAFVPDFMIPPTLKRRVLAAEPFVVLLRKDHPASKRRFDLDAYLALSHALVAPRGLPGSIVDSALEKLGKTRRVVARIQHFSVAPLLAADTDLAVTLPRSSVSPAVQWLPIVIRDLPLDLALDRASIVWHERAHADDGHVWLRAKLDELLGGSRASESRAPDLSERRRKAEVTRIGRKTGKNRQITRS